MTRSFKDTIYLFVCAARGIDAQIEKISASIDDIYRIAMSQGIWYTIYPVLKKLCDEGKIVIATNILHNYEQDFLKVCAFQIKRRSFEKRILERFSELGIQSCLLKGDSIARFYNEPLLRVSSDIDLKIQDKDIDAVISLLMDEGFKIEPLKKGKHHFECYHSIYGTVEIHVKYCMDITNDICFKNAIKLDQKLQRVYIDDIGAVNVLNCDDELVFLFMHYIKHFISRGAGIRQLMDIALYIENCATKESMKKIYEMFGAIGYSDFIQNIIYICAKYLQSKICQSFCKTNIDESKIKAIMNDIEYGGIFGNLNCNRIDFYKVYLRERTNKINCLAEYNNEGILKKLFPPLSVLSVRYTYLRRSLWFYPVAVVHRILQSLIYRLSIKKIDKVNDDDIRKRINFLESVGLI